MEKTSKKSIEEMFDGDNEKNTPEVIDSDPFYSAENIAEIKRRIDEIQSGVSILKAHDLVEVDDQ